MKYRTKAQEFEVTDLHNGDTDMRPGNYYTMTIEGVQHRIMVDEIIVNDGVRSTVLPRVWFDMFCEPVPEETEEAEETVGKQGRRGRSR